MFSASFSAKITTKQLKIPHSTAV